MARLLRFVSIAVVALAMIAASDTAWAQRGGRGGGPGGPGGPGGMRMPDRTLSMMYGALLNAPTVQKDIDLLDDQKAKIKEIGDKAGEAMKEVFSGMGDMRDLSDEERAKKQEEMMKKMRAQGEKTTKAIEGVLLPDQLKRLRGIALQRMGLMALGDKTVQKDLKMKDEQVAKLKSIRDEAMKKMGELFRPGADRDEMRKKGEAMRKEIEKKTLDVLTADQQKALEKMKGKKLTIPEKEMPRMGFGGGPRGGRPPRGGGNGGGPDRPID
jgi:hypothetical protein